MKRGLVVTGGHWWSLGCLRLGGLGHDLLARPLGTLLVTLLAQPCSLTAALRLSSSLTARRSLVHQRAMAAS